MNTKGLIKQNFAFYILVLFITSCTTQKKSVNCGVVLFKSLFYQPSEKKYLFNELVVPAFKIWYKDSSVIIKMMGISRNIIDGVVTKTELKIDNFTYIDLKKMFFYKYNFFTDTASIIQSYNKAQSDTLYWGPKFYENKSISHIKSFENLADTTIEHMSFKRIKMIENLINDTTTYNTSIAYFDCAKQGTILQINKSLSKYAGCPMVGYYLLPTKKHPNPRATEVEFITDKLTPEELKVFSAWEQNAKKHPVQQ